MYKSDVLVRKKYLKFFILSFIDPDIIEWSYDYIITFIDDNLVSGLFILF